MSKLQKTLDSEKVKKVEAINKLTQVMFSRPPTRTGKQTAEPRRQDREIRKLRGELQRETEKFNNLVAKYHKDLEDVQLVRLSVCVFVYTSRCVWRLWFVYPTTMDIFVLCRKQRSKYMYTCTGQALLQFYNYKLMEYGM